MDHSYFQDRISAFLDNSLPPYEQEAVSRHVDECEACQSLANQLAKVDQLVEKYSGLNEDDYWESSARKIEEKILSSTKETQGVSRGGIVTRLFGQPGVAWKATALAASMALITFIALHEQDISQNVELFDDSRRLEKLAPVIDSTSNVSVLESPTIERRKIDYREVDRVGEDRQTDAESSIRKSAPVRTRELSQKKKATIGDVARPSEARVSRQVDNLAPDESVDNIVGTISKDTDLPSLDPAKDEKVQIETKVVSPALKRERILKSIDVPSRPTETLRSLSAAERARLKSKVRVIIPTNAEDEIAPELSLSDPQPDSVSQQPLAYWRERKSELEKPAPQKSFAKSGLKSLAVEDNEHVRHRLDSTLLVCHFNIARLTSDSAEYKISVDYLTDYFEADLRWLAEQFLDSLGENK